MPVHVPTAVPEVRDGQPGGETDLGGLQEKIRARLVSAMLHIDPRADLDMLHEVMDDFLRPLDRTGLSLLSTSIASSSSPDRDLIARDLLAIAEERAYRLYRAAWIDPLYSRFREIAAGPGLGAMLARKALEVLARPFDDGDTALAHARKLAAQAAAHDSKFLPLAAALKSLVLPSRAYLFGDRKRAS